MKRPLTIAITAILLLQMISVAWAWELERPSALIDIKERTDNAYTNGEASVGLGVAVDKYLEDFADYGADTINMNVSMTGNSRMGIEYNWRLEDDLWWIPETELDHRNDMVGVGDDWGSWIEFPEDFYLFLFRFYGGLWSAEYKSVWVCSNGFIAFDLSNSTCPYPSDIPHPANPNAIIAAVWTDLHIDNDASIITGLYEEAISGNKYFVITWKNVLHEASGKRLTFQIILEDAPWYYPADRRYGQSRIWISYESVSSINTNFALGIEDQQGRKGLGGLCSGGLGSFNRETIKFCQCSNSYFLKELTLSFQDTEPQTEFNIVEDDGYYLRGNNIQRNYDQPSEPDGTYMFVTALAGTATLLIGVASPWGWLCLAGVMVETVLVGLDWAEYLAYRQYSGQQVEVFDRQDGLQQQASATALTYDYVVDASLSMIVHWILKTPNNIGTHSLTVTAKLEYYEYTIPGGEIIEKPPITTSVNLKIGPDDNNSFDTADEISEGIYSRLYLGGYDAEDYYKIHLYEGCRISVRAWATSSPAPDFYLDLYSPEREWKDGSPGHGYSHYISFTVDSTGDWFIKARVFENYGFYSLRATVYIPGGCPFVYAWNGTNYVIDNNLLPASETSDGADVEDYYKLEQTLVPKYEGKRLSLYSLLIKEFEHEHSYFDQIRLLAVDHDPNVNVAVSPKGDVLTYIDPVAPISAINSHENNVLTPLWSIDDHYYEGFDGDYLILNFGEINTENAKIVMRVDSPPIKKSIYVQVLDSAGNWLDVATVIPRTYWATEIVDLSDYLPNSNSELKVRLYFTANHKIDYVGLDTSKQANKEVHHAYLISAIHSSEGHVTIKLLNDDNAYTELLPEQQIELTFILPKQPSKNIRTFIIYAKGHYYIIAPQNP